MKVMLTDKRWEWRMRMMNGLGGRKASETHSSLSLDMSLSKALNPSTLLESSLGEIV